MNKLVLVYNPRSAQHVLIKNEVLTEVRKLAGWMVAKFEVKPSDLADNAGRLAQILNDGDLVIAAGGDGTAAMTLNGVLVSGKKVTLGMLGYGHFNDFAHTLAAARASSEGDGKMAGGVAELVRRFQAGETRKYYPLEVTVDQKFWRYAACYMTIGMAAEAAEIFDQKAVRKKIQRTSHPRSYFRIAMWYYKNRRKREFVPALKINGQEMQRATDIIALNTPFMAKVMRGDKWYEQAKSFAAGGFWLKRSWTLFKFMMRSMFRGVPLEEVKQLKLEFSQPAQFTIQTDGEYESLDGVRMVEVKKGPAVQVV